MHEFSILQDPSVMKFCLKSACSEHPSMMNFLWTILFSNRALKSKYTTLSRFLYLIIIQKQDFPKFSLKNELDGCNNTCLVLRTELCLPQVSFSKCTRSKFTYQFSISREQKLRIHLRLEGDIVLSISPLTLYLLLFF